MAYTVQQIIAALKLYDKIKKVVPTVRQLGYPAAHTLYEWINLRKATNGKFPNLMPSGVKSINLKVKMDHDGYSAERKFQILKRCFEGTENIRDVAIEEGISRNIIYIWRKSILNTEYLACNRRKRKSKGPIRLKLK